MKKVSLLALAFAVTTSAVSAQEIAVVPTAPCPPQPCPCPQAFKGFYLGGSFGYGFGAVRKDMSLPGINIRDKFKQTVQGFDGGVLLGYNYVFCNKFGLGLEAYFNWMSVNGTHSGNVGRFPFRIETSLKNSIQVRVPFSYVIANLVAPKVVVGWDNAAWTHPRNITLNQALRATDTARSNGFLWGAGVDFLLAKHIISGLEYTGVVYQTKSVRDTNTNRFSYFPIYNTVKATLKFIY